MSVKIKFSQSVPAPNGEHVWTIDEITDLGIKPTKFGPKPTVKVSGVIDKLDDSGAAIRVSKTFTAKMNARSNLFAFVEKITGRRPRPDARNEFDGDSLIGLSALIETQQRVTERGTFANIVSMKPLPAGTRVAIPLNYQPQSKPNGKTADHATAFPGD